MTEIKNKISLSFPWGLIIFLVFLVLKLTDNIDWSWWWVTAPLWIPIGIGLLTTVIAITFVGLVKLLNI